MVLITALCGLFTRALSKLYTKASVNHQKKIKIKLTKSSLLNKGLLSYLRLSNIGICVYIL